MSRTEELIGFVDRIRMLRELLEAFSKKRDGELNANLALDKINES